MLEEAMPYIATAAIAVTVAVILLLRGVHRDYRDVYRD